MNYRVNNFYARKNFAADATVVVDLNMTDILSTIVLQYSPQNATHTMAGPVMGGITKIELIDGSDVLHSITGLCNEGMDWYHRGGNFNYNYNYHNYGSGADRVMSINFGRYLWDQEYAFDPKRFTNPQLRITLDISAGGNTPTSVYLTMWANMFDDLLVNPVGFFMTKEIKQWTASSTVHEYTDLPTDYPYRNIYLQARLADTETRSCITNIKLSEDNDKRIPLDLNQHGFQRVSRGNYPQVVEHFYCELATSTRYIYCAATDGVAGVGQSWAAEAAELNMSCYQGDGGYLYIDAATIGGNIQLFVRGDTPHNVLQLPAGIQDDPATWWDVRNIGSLKADITGGANAICKLFIQQVRSY